MGMIGAAACLPLVAYMAHPAAGLNPTWRGLAARPDERLAGRDICLWFPCLIASARNCIRHAGFFNQDTQGGGFFMISKVISAAAIAAAAVSLGACSSSETSTLANGLIASASLTDKNDAEAGAKIGQTAGTTFTFTTVDEDTTDVSWNTGPYSGKTRTFELKDTDTVGGYEVAEYGYVKGKDDKDDGVLFVTGVGDAGFALGAMFTEGKSGAAAGATHFGEAPTNIPSSGTVGYAGLNAGVTVNDDDTGDQFAEYYGTSEITANFGTGIVEGTLEASGLDTITFTGQMSQGNAVYAANNADIFYGDASVSANSKLIGGFYNDHASSTAGVYDVQTLGDTPIRAIGGFAARNYAG